MLNDKIIKKLKGKPKSINEDKNLFKEGVDTSTLSCEWCRDSLGR